MAEQDRWGIVYSPQFSLTNTHKRWNLIRKHLQLRGVQYDFVQSESSSSVGRLATMMCNNGYHTIVVVGNDASLNDAVNAMMNCKDKLPDDFAFGVIPNGTGNDFARFWCDDVRDYAGIIDAIINRKVKKIDVALCVYHDDGIPQRRYFINCMNAGLGAKLVKTSLEAAQIIGMSKLTFFITLIRRVFERSQFDVALQIDTERPSGTYMSMCIGNCHGYGQTPNAVPYNGMLDVSLITRPQWWQLFEGFWLLGQGRFLNYRNVHPYRSEQIVIEHLDRAYVSFDGAVLPIKNPEPLKLSVVANALSFIIPR